MPSYYNPQVGVCSGKIRKDYNMKTKTTLLEMLALIVFTATVVSTLAGCAKKEKITKETFEPISGLKYGGTFGDYFSSYQLTYNLNIDNYNEQNEINLIRIDDKSLISSEKVEIFRNRWDKECPVICSKYYLTEDKSIQLHIFTASEYLMSSDASQDMSNIYFIYLQINKDVSSLILNQDFVDIIIKDLTEDYYIKSGDPAKGNYQVLEEHYNLYDNYMDLIGSVYDSIKAGEYTAIQIAPHMICMGVDGGNNSYMFAFVPNFPLTTYTQSVEVETGAVSNKPQAGTPNEWDNETYDEPATVSPGVNWSDLEDVTGDASVSVDTEKTDSSESVDTEWPFPESGIELPILPLP